VPTSPVTAGSAAAAAAGGAGGTGGIALLLVADPIELPHVEAAASAPVTSHPAPSLASDGARAPPAA
jgi:hypothetical protein